ncbi:MAG: CPBP family intramembrane metalloprotease [Anaerolineales bacterium]|nr:CPBP family intramembrane metalloprotease [Anaerolineales bacterium]
MDIIRQPKRPEVHIALILLFTAAGLIVFGVALITSISYSLRLGAQAGLILALIALTIVFYKQERLKPHWRLPYLYLVASWAVMLSSFFGAWTVILSGQSVETVKGFTLMKLGEDVAVISVILLFMLLTWDDPKELYLSKGSLGLGLGIGLGSLVIFSLAGYFAAVARGLSGYRLGVLLPAFGLVMVADGFMQELLFRGLFLKRLGRLLGNSGANVVTALVFAYAHLGGQYTASLPLYFAILFLLGLLWGWLMQKTGSILAPALFHAGVNMLISAAFGAL